MCLVIRARELPADPPDVVSEVSPEVGGCCLDREIDLEQGEHERGDALEPSPQLAMETR